MTHRDVIVCAECTQAERDRLRSEVEALRARVVELEGAGAHEWTKHELDESLRIAAALAECAPTVEDRYNWSAKDHAELPALVAALRERAEKAERERDEAKTIASNIAASWVAEAEKAHAEAAELRAEVERLRGRRFEMRQLLRRMVMRVQRDGATEPLTQLAEQVADYLSRTAEPRDVLRLQGTDDGKRAREALGK